MKNFKFFFCSIFLSLFLFSHLTLAFAGSAERGLYDEIKESINTPDDQELREISLNLFFVKQGARLAYLLDPTVRENLGKDADDSILKIAKKLDIHCAKSKDGSLIFSKAKLSNTKLKKSETYLAEKLGYPYTGILWGCTFIDRTSYSFYANLDGEKTYILSFVAPSQEIVEKIRKHEGKKIADQLLSIPTEAEKMREHFELAVKEIDEEAVVTLEIEEIPASEKVSNLDEALSKFKNLMDSLVDKVKDKFDSLI